MFNEFEKLLQILEKNAKKQYSKNKPNNDHLNQSKLFQLNTMMCRNQRIVRVLISDLLLTCLLLGL